MFEYTKHEHTNRQYLPSDTAAFK